MDEMQCPICGSSNVYIDKKGYSVTNGAIGALLTGNVLGLAGGLIGSNKIVCECLSCGYKFSPDEAREKALERQIIDNFHPGDYSMPNIDTSDDILEIFKRDASDAEVNGDYDMALLNWQMCLDHLQSSGKDPDLYIVNRAIICARDHGSVFRLAVLYEDLIKLWPLHPQSDVWRNELSKLDV